MPNRDRGATEPRGPDPVLQPVADWLDRRISPLSNLVGWIVATIAFVGLISYLGGPSQADTYQSVFSTWSIEHGQFACAFPSGFKVTAPLYPLLSGGIAALGRVGHAVSFPFADVRGPECQRAFLAINYWSIQARAINDTIRIGLICWFVLMAGVISCVRAFGRGRRLWEPAALLTVALLPPVWMCIEHTFHPEDLLAIGFGLCAVALAKRGLWWAAGVFAALAILSQQYALLIAIPLLIAAPSGRRRIIYVASAAASAAIILVPMVLAGSTGAFHAAVFGTGDTGGVGGAVLWEFGLHGPVLVFFSRILPLLLSAALTVWACQRLLPGSALDATPLCCIIAVSLGLRLVFEQQIFGYYYMPLAVTLLLLCVATGRIFVPVLVWIAAVSLTYNEPFPSRREDVITIGFFLLAAALLGLRMIRERPQWADLLWVSLLGAALLTFKGVGLLGEPPTWLWQTVFVSTGIALAIKPLGNLIKKGADVGVSDALS